MTLGRAKDLAVVFLLVAVFGLMIALLIGFNELSNVGSQNHALGSQNRALGGQNRALIHRVAADEHATCVIQRRGLPAGHALKNVMVDVLALLTQPATDAERRQQRHESRRLRRVLANLDAELGVYVKAERHQPHGRNCPTVMPAASTRSKPGT